MRSKLFAPFFWIFVIALFAVEFIRERRLRAKAGTAFEPGDGIGAADDYTDDSNVQSGRATWYGDEARGKIMANGLLFNPDNYTAAMDSLPLGSLVCVTAPSGRNIIVRLTDRLGSGAHRNHVLIDLSRAAFRAICPLRPNQKDPGHIEVTVAVVISPAGSGAGAGRTVKRAAEAGRGISR